MCPQPANFEHKTARIMDRKCITDATLGRICRYPDSLVCTIHGPYDLLQAVLAGRG